MQKALRLGLAVVMLVSMLSAIPLVAPSRANTLQTYMVLYRDLAVPSDAAISMGGAGGTLIYQYDAIGVAIARSGDATFREKLLWDNRIENAVTTAGYAVKLNDDVLTNDVSGPSGTLTPSGGNLSSLQWDMKQIHAPEARAITGGSPSVLVGDIDTGLDSTHRDLAPNVDSANSVNCVGGVPVPGATAAADDNGHGTHTAGIIAAAGIGTAGVAPNVRIAGIKAGDSAGFFFPEAVVCAFMWAGTHHMNVTNNSYFADPWLFNCRNDPVQRAIWNAERRAIRFAMQQGVTVVAAAGNQADDLAHPTQDVTSPDNTTPVTRAIHNDCAVIPVEVPGVIGVTANGNLELKSFYSSYGVGTVQVIAPGGDSILQKTAAALNGRVLSTWPATLIKSCIRKVFDGTATYCYAQGTSMASPHVAGVAALVMSQFGPMMPGKVQAVITQTADPMACPPDLSIYSFFPAVDNAAPQVCQGGIGYNSFNGHGQVNAFSAVTHSP